jgi:phage FluMu protein gp41
LISRHSNRLLIWIGAGASRWRQVPSWEQLANQIHLRFSKFESNYDRSEGKRLIDLKDFPALFQICRDANEGRYFKELLNFIRPKKRTGVYLRFIESLRALQPIHILTTNVDELLENSLDGIPTVQRSDLARCLDLLREGNGFIGKIHGSISQAESMVFTSSDYDALMLDKNYLDLIRHIFVETTVLFIGYGLRDQYVLKLLESSNQLKGLFDNQNHYAVVSENQTLPRFIVPIRYLPIPHKDHRSSIQVIEELGTDIKTSNEIRGLESKGVLASLKSAHLISDIFPPGKTSYAGWQYTISDGARVLHGVGLMNDELLSSQRNSTHDLLVGLICFDSVQQLRNGLESGLVRLARRGTSALSKRCAYFD